ncbi:MAG: glycosyltransferase [Myxococcaceae bacterium]
MKYLLLLCASLLPLSCSSPGAGPAIGPEEVVLPEIKPSAKYDLSHTSEIWQQESLEFGNYQEKIFSGLLKQSVFKENLVTDSKIPKILHIVWLSDPKKPAGLKKKDLDLVEKKIKILSGNSNWEFYFWSNIAAENLGETSELIQRHGVQIKKIEDLKSPLVRIFDQLIDDKKFVVVSDIVRILAVLEFGGFYTDNDYELFRSLDENYLKFDSIFSLGIVKDSHLQNAFFAAKKEHPILGAAHRLMVRNFLGVSITGEKINVPEYVSSMGDYFSQVIVITGPWMLSLAFDIGANISGNHDLVLPAGVALFLLNKASESEKKIYEKNPVLFCADARSKLLILGNACEHVLSVEKLGNDSWEMSWNSLKDIKTMKLPLKI